MKHTITLPIEPLSINKVHCRDTRYFTSHYNKYVTEILHIISKESNARKLKELREAFNINTDYYKLDITYYYPRSQMFTAKNTISSKAHDISNIEKPLIDILFLPKFCRIGIDNLKIDDKYIKDMRSRQLAADKHLITFTLEIRKISELESTLID